MKKARADSLYAKLAAADPSLELREWVFYAAIIEAKSLEEIGGALHDKGIITSDAAIGKMLQRHTLRWKLDTAKDKAREVDKWIPDKKHGSIDEQCRKNLKKQIFNASMENLTTAEIVALSRALTDQQRADAMLYKIQYDAADFVAAVMKDEAKAKALRELATEGNMTPAQYIEAVRHRMYGDAAAAIPGKEGTAS